MATWEWRQLLIEQFLPWNKIFFRRSRIPGIARPCDQPQIPKEANGTILSGLLLPSIEYEACMLSNIKRPNRALRLALLLYLVLLQTFGLLQAQDASNPAQLLPTVAERSNYTATASGAEVEAYLGQLANYWRGAELTTIGSTNEGRPIWALHISPTVVGNSKPVTVMMLGGIHSGECDGKEALLALARDMAMGQHGDWWHSLRLIFVPNFSADSNERRGAGHRPGQAGPEAGMGIRENAQGLDLNRDFVKLESPEVRGLVAALNGFDVDILIDTHTTNGSLHQYQLTYDIPHNPATPRTIDSWLRNKLMPTVTGRLNEAGFSTYYYGNFDREHRRWTTYGYEPRYSTEYMGLRGRLGILAESYSYASYETRVNVSYAFVKEILQAAAEYETTIRQLVDDSAWLAGAGSLLPIRGKLAKTAEGVVLKGFQQPDGSTPQGPYGPEAFDRHQKKDYTVELWNRAEVTKQIRMAACYVVPSQYAWAISRLVRHGVKVNRLTTDIEAAVEIRKVTTVEKRPEFQGHEILRVETETRRGTVPLVSGSYVVNSSQPLGVLAAYLLEPESDDSLVAWNFFDPDIEVGIDYPVLRVLDEIPEEALGPVSSAGADEKITLERLMKPGKVTSYGGSSIRGADWLKDSSEYIVSSGRRSYAVDAATGSSRRLSELDTLRGKLAALEAFTDKQAESAATVSAFTDDWKHALISHSDDLYYFDAASEVVRQLTHSPDQPERLAELSPLGKHVAYVFENNLWVVDCESTEARQLTDDGSEELLNGILDWVYQEELYGRGKFKAFWWSPDGKSLAFLKLDQTPVPRYQVSDSISFGQTLEATRYPKAGEPLPQVDVWLANIESGELRKVDLSNFDPADRLVARVTWSPAGELWLQVFNRVQNKQDLVQVDAENGLAKVVMTEMSPGWIEVRGTPHFLPDGDFLWLSDLPNGRTHLFRVSVTSGQRTQLTSGDWDVASLLSVAEDSSTAFVNGNISSPTDSQLVAVDLKTGSTFQVTISPGTHRATVDASGKYFIDVFGSTSVPSFASLGSIDGQTIRIVEAPTSDRHEFLDIAPPRSLTIPAHDGFEMQAQILLPPGVNFDDADTPLPVLFYVYGGPQAPTVRNAWGGRNYWWHQMLCQQGFAVVLCDNRAALGRGVKDTWTIRGDLCRVELQDLEDAVDWVGQQPWADKERIGLWGWSYGGYFTSYALTHSQLFKCGIAGAPVTDWRNYDAIYTERYMDLPQNNEAGYTSSSSVQAAKDLHGRLLIIHGERDDNVHVSNSLQLAYALQKAGKQFDMMIYPKNRHGIVDEEQRYHMYQMMTDFLVKHLQGE